MSQRNEHLEEVIAIFKTREDFSDRLKSLHQKCSEIETYYHEYDYKDVECNGFRSFVQSVDLYFEKLAKAARKKKGKMDSKTVKQYDDLSQLLDINADAAAMIREKGVDYPLQFIAEPDVAIMQKLLEIEPKHIEPLLGKIAPFNIKKEFRSQLLETVMGLHVMMSPTFASKARMVLSPGFRVKRQAEGVVCMDMDMVASAQDIHKFPVKTVMKLVLRPAGCTKKRIAVPRNFNDWRIHLPDNRSLAVIRRKSHFTKTPSSESMLKKLVRVQESEKRPPVDCLLIKPKRGVRNKSLMIHMPSGGFFMALADVYVPLMSKVSRDLGIAVVLPKYALTPECPYPASLQDILDLYMFFTSGSSAVSFLLGFLPENILLSGDSAGSNLAITTTIALNEIRKLGGEVRLPKAIALQSPAMTIGFVTSPGMALSGLDIFATIGELRLAVAAYAETDLPIDLNHHLKNYKDVQSWAMIMARYNDRLKDPLHNPLVYDHFDDFSGIPISILASEMDTIVDHAVQIAKKWPGPVTMDVARRLPHTFLATQLTPRIAEDVELLVQRLAAGLDIPLR